MREFDEEALRERLMDIVDIESASGDELLEIAERLGVDPEEY